MESFLSSKNERWTCASPDEKKDSVSMKVFHFGYLWANSRKRLCVRECNRVEGSRSYSRRKLFNWKILILGLFDVCNFIGWKNIWNFIFAFYRYRSIDEKTILFCESCSTFSSENVWMLQIELSSFATFSIQWRNFRLEMLTERDEHFWIERDENGRKTLSNPLFC